MFWIEQSPTNAADDDSDVPFDESPGQPMACEQEIELVIRPDDDLYPYKSLDADDADTWPETLSAFGGTNTHDGSSSYEDQSTVHLKESSTSNDEAAAAAAAEDGSHSVQPLETIEDDDDVTQVMGEHHSVEGPEDEHTFNSAQDASFVYLKKVASELSASKVAAAEEETPAPEDSDAPASSLLEEEEKEALAATAATSSLNSEDEAMAAAEHLPQQQQPQEVGTTPVPTAFLVEEESSAPGLVSEPELRVENDDDDAENDSLSATSSSSSTTTKPLNEMADQYDDDLRSSGGDWYDQWEPLEETEDGISCLSNMFAPIDNGVFRPLPPPLPQPREEIGVEIPSLSNPTMTTVFSDGAEAPNFVHHYSPQRHLPLETAAEDAQEATSASSSTNSSSSCSGEESNHPLPFGGKQVVLIFEGEEGELANTDMTLNEFLNANCQQGSRKERRLRIMERQRHALSRIQPMPASSSVAPGSHATGGGPGFFDQLFEFDPMEQLQNIATDLW